MPAARRRPVLALGCCLALTQAQAQAAEPAPHGGSASAPSPLALTWLSADADCGGSAVVTRAIELLPPGITPRRIDARAEVSHAGQRWVVNLETAGENHRGTRVLEGESCQELQEAIALLLAMILESEAKAQQAEALPRPPPAPVPAPAPPAPAPTWSSPASLPSDSLDGGAPAPPSGGLTLGWLVRAQTSAGWGLQPGPEVGLAVGVAVGLTLGDWELGIGGTRWLNKRTSILDGMGTLDATRESLGLFGCYRLLEMGWLSIVPCVGPELSRFEWRSDDLDNSRHGTKPFLGLTSNIDLRARLYGPLFAAVSPGLTWELRQPFGVKRCDSCGLTTALQTDGISGHVRAGLGVRF